MNSEHAQIETAFELFELEPGYIELALVNNNVTLWLHVMAGTFFHNMGGEFYEVGVSENELWEWKHEQEKYGSIVFWMKRGTEIYALALPKKGAKLFYGLWKMSVFDGIKSTWK